MTYTYKKAIVLALISGVDKARLLIKIKKKAAIPVLIIVFSLLILPFLVRWELGFLLLYRGMPEWQMEVVMGKPDIVDTLPGTTPPDGVAYFYYQGFFRPFLAVEWGRDRRVLRVHRFDER